MLIRHKEFYPGRIAIAWLVLQLAVFSAQAQQVADSALAKAAMRSLASGQFEAAIDDAKRYRDAVRSRYGVGSPQETDAGYVQGLVLLANQKPCDAAAAFKASIEKPMQVVGLAKGAGRDEAFRASRAEIATKLCGRTLTASPALFRSDKNANSFLGVLLFDQKANASDRLAAVVSALPSPSRTMMPEPTDSLERLKEKQSEATRRARSMEAVHNHSWTVFFAADRELRPVAAVLIEGQIEGNVLLAAFEYIAQANAARIAELEKAPATSSDPVPKRSP